MLSAAHGRTGHTAARGIPTEIPLEESDGLARPRAASFDNFVQISRALLTERVGFVTQPPAKICRALAALADC
jgi:hypothetical protein